MNKKQETINKKLKIHNPVLLQEIIKYLDPKPNENFVDCTYGFGGHSKAILEKIAPNGKVLGIEWDTEIYDNLKSQILNLKSNERLILVNDSYTNLKEIVEQEKFTDIAGILFDLGMSSWDIDESGRGFSFKKDEPLDMRYNKNFQTAEEIINEWSEEEIKKILWEYGEEKWAGRIAKKIITARQIQPIKTTLQLVEVISQAIPLRFQRGKTHFATRVYQALRIAVNQELENLQSVLPQALQAVKPNGKIAIISFHSLEDRIVKRFFKENSQNGLLKILTKKPVISQPQEILENPKSRSAKLRVAIKL